MKTNYSRNIKPTFAFTLVEMLVVIAVIGILAAMLLPVGAMLKKKAAIKRVQTEIQFVDAAIQKYNSDLGHNPPDNPANYAVNQLFYELIGTKSTNATVYFETESGANGISVSDMATFYGSPISGFVNVSASGSGDENKSAKHCLTGLKITQYLEVQNPYPGGRVGTVLGVSAKGPLMLSDASGEKIINPIRYDASSTNRHNTKGFDLWVDILMDGKTNRISNWNEKPEIVP